MAVVDPRVLPEARPVFDAMLRDSSGNAIALFQGHASSQPCPFAIALPAFSTGRTKTCAQCGTSRTPQWREGPDGPKTLCNACGVKLVRANAKHKDGAKRRPAGGAGAGRDFGGGSGGLAAVKAAPLPKQSSGSLTSDSGAQRPLAASSSALRRPQRKAAAKAATRTAEFASTGDWPEEEAGQCVCGCSRSTYDASDDSAAGLSDAAAGLSDAAEEVAWPALRVPAPRSVAAAAAADADAGPLSPAVAAVGCETAAAVNLLSMSVRDADLPGNFQARSGLGGGGGSGDGGSGLGAAPDPPTRWALAHAHALGQVPLQGLGVRAAAVGSQQLSSHPAAAAAGSGFRADDAGDTRERSAGLGGGRGSPVKAERRSSEAGATTATLAEGEALREARDGAAREAAAADAAVAAVAKILAIKQAAATRARAAAAAAAHDLHAFLGHASGQCGWARPPKKARRSQALALQGPQP